MATILEPDFPYLNPERTGLAGYLYEVDGVKVSRGNQTT